MATDTVTIAEFVRANRITMTAERADSNPNMDNSAGMDHWKCALVLTNGPMTAKSGPACRTMTVYFSKGHGHHGAEPTAAEVLDCLASDASGIENVRDFEDWASDYGYETDSRKAEKLYNVCEHQAKRLRKFLGDSAYETLLWHTERE